MRNTTSDRGPDEGTVLGSPWGVSFRSECRHRPAPLCPRMLTDTDFIDADIQVLEEELTTITGMLRLCIAENAANTVTEETYRTTHAELCNRFEETEAKLAALQKQRDKMKADAITIGGMMFELGELDTLPVIFDEKLWHGTIDHVSVHADERVVFMFKDGKEIVTRL